jgi:hypothetical protein
VFLKNKYAKAGGLQPKNAFSIPSRLISALCLYGMFGYTVSKFFLFRKEVLYRGTKKLLKIKEKEYM